MKKCDECGGKIEHKKTDFKLFGISLGKFDALVCSKCGQTLFTEEISNKIDKVAKEKGLWGLEAKSKVAKVGDSLSIRVNKKLANFLDLKKGEEVTLIPEGKNKLLVIT